MVDYVCYSLDNYLPSSQIVNLDDSDRSPLDFETSLVPENHLIIHLLKEDLESDILYLPPIDSESHDFKYLITRRW